MNLSVPTHLPQTIATLLKLEDELTKSISAEYDRLLRFPYGGSHDGERGEARENIRKMKEERDITAAKLSGWWRSTLTTNGIKWQEEQEETTSNA